MSPRVWPVVVAGVVAALVPGCGESPAVVTGTVTIDGRLLNEGEIIFEAADKGKTPAAGPIRDGVYEVRVLPGRKTVRITAARRPVRPDPVLGADAREPMVAKPFNEQSRLTADVRPGRNEGVDFEVKSLP